MKQSFLNLFLSVRKEDSSLEQVFIDLLPQFLGSEERVIVYDLVVIFIIGGLGLSLVCFLRQDRAY